MDWDDIRHFLALARLRSVRAAGASLGVSHSTVLRRVEALEERLGARLFDRNRDGYSLTEAGLEMLPGAERIEQEMAALERGVLGRDDELSGQVTLTCCDNFVADLLLRDLSGFCAAHPDIELHITTDSRAFDLSKREADIAIRTLPVDAQPPEFLIGRRVVPLTLCNYVAVAHAPRLDPELRGTEPRFISSPLRKIQDMMIAGSSYPHVPAWGAFSSLELMAQAAREGLGLVMLPTYVGDRDPALRRLAHPDLRHMADLWLLCHPDLRSNARIKATRTAVAESLSRHGALFRGEPWSVDAPGRPEIAPHEIDGSHVQ